MASITTIILRHKHLKVKVFKPVGRNFNRSPTTEQARINMRIAAKIRGISPETLEKAHLASRGKPSWNKGKKLTPEHIAKTSIGKKNAKSRGIKLSDEDVVNIKNLRKTGLTLMEIAGKYNINKSTVGRLCSNKFKYAKRIPV